MIIDDRLRNRATHLDLRAHFLQSRSKRFNLLLLHVNLATCFEKLVKQHCVYLIVAHAVGLPIGIAHNQIGIHLFLISDALPFGRLLYTKPDEAIGYAEFRS